MKSDRIFILMLVFMLPLTGCFGDDGIGEVEADDTQNEAAIEIFSIGGLVDVNTTGEDRNNYGYDHVFIMYNFTTNAGQAVKIHHLDQHGVNTQYSIIKLVSDCGNSMKWSLYNTYDAVEERWVAGAKFDCTHTVEIHKSGGAWTSSEPLYYSGMYSIHDVTVLM